MGDDSYVSRSASFMNEGAASRGYGSAAPTLRTPHHELSACGGFASLQPLASQAQLSGNNFLAELPPQPQDSAVAVGGLAPVEQLVATNVSLQSKVDSLESENLLLKAYIQTSTSSQRLVSQCAFEKCVSPVPFALGSSSRACASVRASGLSQQ